MFLFPKWLEPPKNLFISSKNVHVWRISSFRTKTTNIEKITFFKILNSEEQSRVHRFKFSKDQIQFTFCRGMLRILLGQYLNLAPNSLEFSYGEKGKPYLKKESLPQSTGLVPEFNVSHCKGNILLAFCADASVGVDLEKVEQKGPWPSLAERYFAPQEIQFLKKNPPNLQNQAGYQLWTLKEAFLKAKGMGLSQDLASFQITWDTSMLQDPKTSPLCKVYLNSKKVDTSPWSLYSFSPFGDYVGALAIKSQNPRVKFFNAEKFLSKF